MDNWDYVAHVIKDVFDINNSVILYGYDHKLINVLRQPQYGVEAWGLYHKIVKNDTPYSHMWSINNSDSYFGFDFCKLLISFDYDPKINIDEFKCAIKIGSVMQKHGLIFTVNAGRWSNSLNSICNKRDDLINEIQNYKMFSDQNVNVYQVMR